jgi:dTDP-4-dehydrorhamnose reductase
VKKLLITGASGFLGYHLCQIAPSKYQVYGTYFRHCLDIANVNLSKLDLTKINELKTLFETIKPDAVIHTAAASKPNFCQTHPHKSYLINVTTSENIALLCGQDHIPCVFTSTDLVFDGLNAPYNEHSPVSPISIYGQHKAIAEQKMFQIYPKIALCRMPLMFGKATPCAHSFMQPFMAKIKGGEELSLFSDEFRTPVSANTAAKGLLLTLEKQISGLIHLGGKERISRYNFGLLMAEVFNLSTNTIKPCSQKDVTMAAPRSPDVSMDSSYAFSLGYQPLSIREELVSLKDKIS